MFALAKKSLRRRHKLLALDAQIQYLHGLNSGNTTVCVQLGNITSRPICLKFNKIYEELYLANFLSTHNKYLLLKRV